MKRMILVIMMVTALSLTACGQQTNDEVNTQKETIWENDMTYLSNNVYTYVDPETGVNYLVFHGYNCAGMSVRYDKTGNIMITNDMTINE